jgi:hypothetical protein
MLWRAPIRGRRLDTGRAARRRSAALHPPFAVSAIPAHTQSSGTRWIPARAGVRTVQARGSEASRRGRWWGALLAQTGKPLLLRMAGVGRTKCAASRRFARRDRKPQWRPGTAARDDTTQPGLTTEPMRHCEQRRTAIQRTLLSCSARTFLSCSNTVAAEALTVLPRVFYCG